MTGLCSGLRSWLRSTNGSATSSTSHQRTHEPEAQLGHDLESWNSARKYHSGLMPVGVTSAFARAAETGRPEQRQAADRPQEEEEDHAWEMSSSQKYGTYPATGSRQSSQ